MPIIVFLKSLPLKVEGKLSVPIITGSAIIIISGRWMPPRPKEIAIVTHQRLGNPYPETMAAALRLLGGSYKREEVGHLCFGTILKNRRTNLKPLPPQDWRITASQEQDHAELIKDRDLLTSWKISKRAGDYLSVDLGRSKTTGRISRPAWFDWIRAPFRIQTGNLLGSKTLGIDI